MYVGEDRVTVLGKEDNLDAACEVIRAHLLQHSNAVIANKDAPLMIREHAIHTAAHINEFHIEALAITGTVVINDEYPEMDHYTITNTKDGRLVDQDPA